MISSTFKLVWTRPLLLTIHRSIIPAISRYIRDISDGSRHKQVNPVSNLLRMHDLIFDLSLAIHISCHSKSRMLKVHFVFQLNPTPDQVKQSLLIVVRPLLLIIFLFFCSCTFLCSSTFYLYLDPTLFINQLSRISPKKLIVY